MNAKCTNCKKDFFYGWAMFPKDKLDTILCVKCAYEYLKEKYPNLSGEEIHKKMGI